MSVVCCAMKRGGGESFKQGSNTGELNEGLILASKTSSNRNDRNYLRSSSTILWYASFASLLEMDIF